MGERDRSLVLVDAGEHFQKYVLGKVFLGNPPWKVGPDDADDEGVQVFDKIPRSSLVAPTNAIKTASQIKRLVVRHAFMEASSNTYCKTPVAPRRLPAAPHLDIRMRPRIECKAEMASASQALRLTSAHDL